MRVTAMIFALGTAGCFTTTHLGIAGPFVKTIDAHRDGIVIESCTIKRERQDHHNILNYLLGQQSSSESTFDQDECSGGFVSLATSSTVPVAPARTAP